MYKIANIKEILTKVSIGKDTCDQQTAQWALDYIRDLEIIQLTKTQERDLLQDKLHRRNMQIKELKKQVELSYNIQRNDMKALEDFKQNYQNYNINR